MALAAFLALAAAYMHAVWSAPTRMLGGIEGDADLSVWFLRWVPYAVSHGHNPLLTDRLNAPVGINLMWTTPMPLAGFLLWPVTAAAGPVVGYNVLILLAFALSAWCAHLAVLRLTGSHAGAVMGGLLYGFSQYMLPQSVGHANLLFVPFPPLLLIVLHDIVGRQRRSPRLMGALAGLLLGCEFLFSEEIAATMMLFSAIGLAVLAILHRATVQARLRHALRALPWAVLVLVLIVAAPLLEQFRGPHRITGLIQEPNIYVSDLLNFVVPTDNVALHTARSLEIFSHFTGNGSEDDAYLGIPLLLVLLTVTVWRWRSPVVRFAGVMGVVSAVLSLGPHLHVDGHVTRLPLPAAVFNRLPLLQNLLPSRLTLYMFLFAAVLVGVFVAELLRSARPWVIAPGALLVALAVAALFPRTTFSTSEVATPAFFVDQRLESRAGGVTLVAPYARMPAYSDPMVWQAEGGIRLRIPEGYFQGPDAQGHRIYGTPPTATSAVMEDIAAGTASGVVTAQTRSRVLADLAAWQVRSVVVGPMPHRAEMVAFFSTLLGGPPESMGGVYLWTSVDPTALGTRAAGSGGP